MSVYALLAALAMGGPACGGGGASGGAGASGAAGTSGAAGAGGGGGTGGGAGAGSMAGTGGSATDAGLGPLSFDLDGVAMSATTAAAQVGSTTVGDGGAQPFLRVLGTTTAFKLNVNLVGAAATTPGSYSCDPSTTGGSLVSYQETATAISYTSFDTSCTVTIDQIGAVGAQVSGTFSGMVRNGAGAPRSITSGRFDVVRAQ